MGFVGFRVGGRDAAIFCALTTLQDQLSQEGAVDVYMVAKLYHQKRPGVFPCVDDFYLLYKAVDSKYEESLPGGDRDSGISNCNNYPATLPTVFVHPEEEENKEDLHKESTM